MRTRLFVTALLFAISAGAAIAAGFDGVKPAVLIARVEILSQQLPLATHDAAGGNVDAFLNLKHAHEEMAAMIAQLKQVENGRDVVGLDKSWANLSTEVSKVLEGQQAVQAFGAIADDFDQKVPVLNSRTDEVARLVADHAGTPAQVLIVSRQQLLAERMRRRIQSMRQGGEDSPAAADGLMRDVKFYGVVLDGLIKGNADLGLKAVKDPNARAILAEINTQWTELAPATAKLIDAAPSLQTVREAADNVRMESQTLLFKADPLFKRYNN